eukprot:CAMPEP_0206227452 /NCGR_PEP_ID=MMETSP0047_2-20121206/8633_1 /ASSEMBLY_ACC=CAM_ASM_000192 /TAXON_ID=195065 /ORGANISM="Chroomonas mesostigmatica_cf, Strain CCMP1168" /LENGTH=946 /DNA_ID=CAMNT_0053650609 /DNA_START=46 /DNA_END=2886 /DNA_ORIENTATION=+
MSGEGKKGFLARMLTQGDEPRERWGGRVDFWMASIGAAVGIGNLWRFPYLAYDGGGGAFWLPFLLAIFFIGIPLLILELALGQVYQTGDINCFGKMNRRLRGIGFASIWTGFTIVCYYVVIIGWALIFLVNVGSLPWLGNQDGPVTSDNLGNTGFVDNCGIGPNQLVSDSEAAGQFFTVDVMGVERGRGYECTKTGPDSRFQIDLIGGTNCAGRDVFRALDGSIKPLKGSYTHPCYSRDEFPGGTCTADSECDGMRVCNAELSPAPEFLTGEPKESSPVFGVCDGPSRDGPDGTCNPCQKYTDPVECKSDPNDEQCYWTGSSCLRGTLSLVAPLRSGGYLECQDEIFVPDMGVMYKCPVVKTMGLCDMDNVKAACPVTCDACITINVNTQCDQGATGFNSYAFAALIVVWCLVIFCIFFGVRTTGRFAYVTMLIPFIFIIVMMVAGATLEGSLEGVRNYIGVWDMRVLSSRPQLWAQSVGQVFFSFGIGFGILTAYASYNKRDQDVVLDAVVIGISDTIVSFLAGFAVFCVLGNFSFRSGVPVNELTGISGFGLAFSTYPVALSKLPGGQGWCAVFFLTLALLGLDSAFAIVEAVVTALKDSNRFYHIHRQIILLVVAFLSLLIGVFFCLDNGLYTLDAVDYYANSLSLVFVGLMEAIAVGWVFGMQEQVALLGAPAVAIYNGSWLLGVVGGCEIGFYLGRDYGDFAGVTFGVVTILCGSGIAMLVIRRSLSPHLTEGQRQWALVMGNVEQLRFELNAVVCPEGSKNNKIPMLWSFLLKYLCCTSLCAILAITFNSDFGKYGNYAERYQGAGLIFAALTIAFVAIGIVYPDIYDSFGPQHGSYAEGAEDAIVWEKHHPKYHDPNAPVPAPANGDHAAQEMSKREPSSGLSSGNDGQVMYHGPYNVGPPMVFPPGVPQPPPGMQPQHHMPGVTPVIPGVSPQIPYNI